MNFKNDIIIKYNIEIKTITESTVEHKHLIENLNRSQHMLTSRAKKRHK